MTEPNTRPLNDEMDILGNTLLWFKKAVPEPQLRNVQTQVAVHFEEVGEMIDAITPATSGCLVLMDAASSAIKALADYLKNSEPGQFRIQEEDRHYFLDGLCDQIVTATGIAHMVKMDIIGGMIATNISNFSKFDSKGEPIFNEHGKVTKGPLFKKADYTQFV